MSSVKRARMRAAPVVGTSTSQSTCTPKYKIPNDMLLDFCRVFLSNQSVKRSLEQKITRLCDDTAAAAAAESQEFRPVPLEFDSSQQYLHIFQPLVMEETQQELTSVLCSAQPLPRIGFPLKLQDHVSENGSDQFATRVCRLRAEFLLPDRHNRPFKDWKTAEQEQVSPRGMMDGQCKPVGLSPLCRGDVVILLDKEMMIRSTGDKSKYTTGSEMIALGVVYKPARPVSGGRDSPGAIDFDVGVSPETAEMLHGRDLVCYLVPECNLVTSWRMWDGMNSLFSDCSCVHSPLLPALLCKEKPSAPTDGVLNLNLPGLTPQFQASLFEQYNSSQLDAIAAAVASKTNGFVLVQGPPGTGKTHTLYGMLNALHLSLSQLSYDNVLPTRGSSNAQQQQQQKFDWLSDDSNPHLLICAPSNAAIDNVLRLVTEKGFRDGVGNTYRPTCVRIGSSNWNRNNINNSSSNNNFSLDAKVEELMRSRTNPDDSTTGTTDSLAKKLKMLEMEIRHTGNVLVDLVNENGRGCQTKEYHEMAAKYIAYRTRARDIALDLERRRLLYLPNGNDSVLRADMRALILTQANLVFATLAQCGSAAICEIAPKRVKFQVCVIDEAAQCVEPSVLTALSLGVDRCIMVGDPNQLPATVISEAAIRAKFEQSMFERLQLAGHPVHLLNTQYRCRPEMSSFSSKTFYQSKLKDGANVLQPTYRIDIPFPSALMFFDVGFGIQRRTTNGFSMYNEDEVMVCVELYRAIRSKSKTAHVAIISPYKDQLDLLKRRFDRSQNDAKLEFNTVDGFQGREVDIVIFSCVRSKGEDDAGGIGFLADARRLNVAVTRAKYNLFLVGNYDVLKRSQLWRKLLDHVKQVGRSVQMRHVGDIFA